MKRDDSRCRRNSISRSGFARQSVPLVGMAILLSAAGCPNRAAPPTTTGGAAATGAPVDNQCANIVNSIHDTFQLQRLGQTTTITDGVLRLNDWRQSCDANATGISDLPERLRALLSEQQLAAFNGTRYTVRDGEHLRDGVLFRALARHAFETGDTQAPELERVVAAFRYLIHAIELVDRHPQDLPFTPYEIFLLGKGTAADRAWLFARLLQQAKIDSVLIVPSTGEKEGDAGDPKGPLFVGVILDGKTFLFDPRAGVPIPPSGAADSPDPGAGVATLDQAADDAEVLQQLDVDEDHPYPVQSSALRQLRAYLISDVAFWSDRMRALQGQFSGENSMILSDPLQDTGDGAGLWARVSKVGGNRWSADTLQIWAYPEAQLAAHATLSDEQKELFRRVFSPFEAYSTLTLNQEDGKARLVDQEELEDPAAGKFDPGRAKRIRTTKGAQRRARLSHASGDFAHAVQEYHEVWQRSNRLVRAAMQGAAQGALPIEQEKVILHLRAIDDASFWTALCKFQQKNYRVAVNALQRYRAQHPKGAWLRQSRLLLALSLAAQEDYKAAVEELDAVEADDPEYAGYQWLIHQWRSANPEETEADENGGKAGS